MIRPNTSDDNIWWSVHDTNEYKISMLGNSDIVIDIGAHIGAFSTLAAQIGAGRIYAFEASKENYLVAVENLKQFQNVHIENKAVVRSDIVVPEVRLLKSSSGDNWNTGDGNIIFSSDGDIPVEAISFDSIMEKLNSNIRLLKLDCEGSEFQILLTTKYLHRIQEIVLEYHEIGGPRDMLTIPEGQKINGVSSFTADVLIDLLRRNGFNIIPYGVGVSRLGKIKAYK